MLVGPPKKRAGPSLARSGASAMKTDIRAHLEPTGAMVLVGSSAVAGKAMTDSLPIVLVGGLSSAIGAAILSPVFLPREGDCRL